MSKKKKKENQNATFDTFCENVSHVDLEQRYMTSHVENYTTLPKNMLNAHVKLGFHVLSGLLHVCDKQGKCLSVKAETMCLIKSNKSLYLYIFCVLSQMSGMNQVMATCWTCLLLSAFLLQPALSKGGRGGSRGSSRGSPSRSSTAGTYRGGGAYGGGTRSRFRVAGRSSPVRVASAAAAGAAVALSADKWYASAYRRSNADSSEEELDYFNRTDYFDALMSSSTQNGSFLSRVVSIIIATFPTNYGLLLDSIL